MEAQMAATQRAEMLPINGPFDGQMFRDATLAEFRSRLMILRGAGYNVPQDAFERIDAELVEEGQGPAPVHASDADGKEDPLCARTAAEQSRLIPDPGEVNAELVGKDQGAAPGANGQLDGASGAPA
jgi:hypothetical protein